MSTCLVHASKPFRIALILVLPCLLSAWTCTAIIGFNSCPDALPQPQIVTLLPDTISADDDSVDLTVEGSGFISQSEILWNGSPLPTTFVDSGHLQTRITHQTMASLGGGLAGTNVLISVMSPAPTFVVGCSGWASGTLVLAIN
jgi:hypothetical protein